MARVYDEVHQTHLRGERLDGENNLISRIIYLIGGVIVSLLGFRFLLALLGANPDNSFAHFIYSISRPFAQQFFGLFKYKSQLGITRFEYETIIAIIFYSLATWLLVRLVNIGRDY